VAAHALHEGVRTCEREAGLEVVELRSALLRSGGIGKKQDSQGIYAAEQSMLSHISPRAWPFSFRRSRMRSERRRWAAFCRFGLIDPAEPLPL
jgi:hypothetical protein